MPIRVVHTTSFKGGSGKTTCLANLAARMIARGRRILCVDADLEAPGLYAALKYPQLANNLETDLDRKPTYINNSVSPEGAESILGDLSASFIDVGELDPRCPEGRAFFLPADPRQEETTELDETRAKGFLTNLCRAGEEQGFDFLLVDCPAGVTNMSQTVVSWAGRRQGLALVVLKWSAQQVLGTANYLRQLNYQPGVHYVVVPGGVPPISTDEQRDNLRTYLQLVNSEISAAAGSDLVADSGIPESETLKWRESVLTWADESTASIKSADRDCLAAFEKLADQVDAHFEIGR